MMHHWCLWASRLKQERLKHTAKWEQQREETKTVQPFWLQKERKQNYILKTTHIYITVLKLPLHLNSCCMHKKKLWWVWRSQIVIFMYSLTVWAITIIRAQLLKEESISLGGACWSYQQVSVLTYLAKKDFCSCGFFAFFSDSCSIRSRNRAVSGLEERVSN